MSEAPGLHLSFETLADSETAAPRTILRVKQQRPPWRVVRGFPAPSGETLAHIHNLSGGILDRDALSFQIDVLPGAQAQVTSTGATRIYRSRSPEHSASQIATAEVHERGYLEYVPDQLIPFAGSRFTQATRIQLRPGASLIWWDRIAPGREASGELFRYDSLSSSFELSVCGQPIAIERWTVEPLLRGVGSIARLGPFRHFASCYVCKAGQPAPFWRSFENRLQEIADRISNPEILWGVTSLRAHGLVIRGVSVNGRPLAEGLIELWKAAKWQLCGRLATIPRKIH